MKAYPVPIRLALLAAVDRGMSKSQAARDFGVGRATVKRYVAQRRLTGSLEPRPQPGRPPLIPPEQHPALLALVAAAPTASQAAYCRRWQEREGTLVSTSTMSRTLHRLGCTRRPERGGRP
jgi:transposase